MLKHLAACTLVLGLCSSANADEPPPVLHLQVTRPEVNLIGNALHERPYQK